MPIPRVVRSSDPGSPELNGLPGSAYNVLKHALDLCGWTLEFDDEEEFKCVFRNNPVTGSGCYVRIDDNSYPEEAWASRCVSVILYEEMSDIDTGVGPHVTEEQSWLKKSHTVDDVARDWMVIADDRTAYFYIYNNGSVTPEQSQLMVFGDYEEYIPGNGSIQSRNNIGSTNVNYLHIGNYILNASSAGLCTPRDPASLDLIIHSSGISPNTHLAGTSATSHGIGGTGQATIPGYTPEYTFSIPYVWSASDTGTVIGKLRGLLIPNYNMNSFNRGQELDILGGSMTLDTILASAASSTATGNQASTSARGNALIIIDRDWDDASL